MTEEERRVWTLIRNAFRGVTLGAGVGLRQGRGLDDYANAQTLAAYRAQDEKNDWSAISFVDLNDYSASLCYFDAEGMRFHLPAFLIADLEGKLNTSIIFHLTYHGQQGQDKSPFARLSVSERMAVREYLLLRLSDREREFDRPLIENALSEYWTT